MADECNESPARFKGLSGTFCGLDLDDEDLDVDAGEYAQVHSSRTVDCSNRYRATHPWFLPEYAQGGDYAGSLIHKSNQQQLLELCADLDESIDDACRPWFLELVGHHGGFGVAIHVRRAPDDVIEVLERLDNHPVLDEDALTTLEAEMEEEAWESWAEREYRDAIERAFADRENGDVEVDADEIDAGDLRDHFEQWSDETGTYWETEGQGRRIDLERIARAAAEAGYPPDGLLIRPAYEADGEDVLSDDPDLYDEAAALQRSRQLNGALAAVDESLLAQGWVVVAITVLARHEDEVVDMASMLTGQVQTMHRGLPSRRGPIAVVLAAFADLQPALRLVALVDGLPSVVDLVVTRYGEGGFYEYYVDGRWRAIPPHGPDDGNDMSGLGAADPRAEQQLRIGHPFVVGDQVYYWGPAPEYCEPDTEPDDWSGIYTVTEVNDSTVTISAGEVDIIAEPARIELLGATPVLGGVEGGRPTVGHVVEIEGLGPAIEFASPLGSIVDDRRALRSQIRRRREDVLPRLRAALDRARKRRRTRAQACQLEGELARAKSRAKQRKCKDAARKEVLDALEALQSERAEIRSMVERARSMVSTRGRKGGLRAQELRRESDDAVRNDLDNNEELEALWEKVKHRIRAGKRRSRTEAFLEWVQDNPQALEELRAERDAQWAAEAEELLSHAPANDVEAYDEDLEAATELLVRLERQNGRAATAVPF